MTETLDNQLCHRFIECVKAHHWAPVFTASTSVEFDLLSAKNGSVTHFMYARDGKLWVGWFQRNAGVQLLFDAYGT